MWRRAASVCLLLALLLLSGCWDVREMNHLALVMAVGIDKTEQEGRIRVTVQIARPGAAGEGKGGAMAGGESGGGGDGPVYTASADGDTIFAAIRNLAQFTSRRLMWAHNNVVVIGEELARDDITPVVDFFTRNQELRMRTWVVVTRGTDARSVVAAKTGMEKIPADSISALFRYAQLPGESVESDMTEIAASFFARDRNPVVAAMRLTERTVSQADAPGEHGGALQAELRGTAVFNKTRLVGYVDQDAGRGLLWLRQQMRNAVITIPCPGGNGKSMAVEVRSPAVKISSDVRGSVPLLRVAVRTEGWLAEQDCLTPQLNIMGLKDYTEKAFARAIEQEIRECLSRLQQEYRVDAVNFARLLHTQHPAWWRQNAARWEELFPRVRVEVSVTTTVPKMGLYTRPMKFPRP